MSKQIEKQADRVLSKDKHLKDLKTPFNANEVWKTVSRRGIRYDTSIPVVGKKSNYYFDPNEMHVLLMRWKEYVKENPKAELFETLKHDLYYISYNFCHNAKIGLYKVKQNNIDLWNTIQMAIYQHYIKTCKYYKTYKDQNNTFSFFFHSGMLIYRHTIGEYYKQFPNGRLPKNEFLEIVFGDKVFSTGGCKVGKLDNSFEDESAFDLDSITTTGHLIDELEDIEDSLYPIETDEGFSDESFDEAFIAEDGTDLEYATD